MVTAEKFAYLSCKYELFSYCILQVVALRASTSNKGKVVRRLFRKAVTKYGWPSRVRGDRGSENLLLAEDIIYRRGNNRGSFLWGT